MLKFRRNSRREILFCKLLTQQTDWNLARFGLIYLFPKKNFFKVESSKLAQWEPIMMDQPYNHNFHRTERTGLQVIIVGDQSCQMVI